MGKRPDLSPATRAIATGRGPVAQTVNPPIYRASTHLYPDCAALRAGTSGNADGNFFYGRRGSPTQWALCEALTALEPGAFGTVLYPSGVAAIAGALMAVLRCGDTILICDNAYDPSRGMATGLLKRMGVTAQFFDPLDLDGYRALFEHRPRAVWLENPGSLTMEICDIPQLAAIAREHDAVSLIDNTWATSLGFPALERGCDIAVQALTKHVGGHSDLMMGSATAGKRWYTALRRASQDLGQVVSPDDAALALRGLRTLPLRLERSAASAVEIARWLATRDEVAHVLCPLLPDTPDHDLFARDFTGGCGLFSFVLKGGDDAARVRFLDALQLFGIGYSWGGFESLALPFDVEPVRDRMTWPKPGWEAGDRFAVRLSIGLEDPADLIADLDQAFDRRDV